MEESETDDSKRWSRSEVFFVFLGCGLLIGYIWRILVSDQRAELLGSPGVWAFICVVLIGPVRPVLAVIGKKAYDILK